MIFSAFERMIAWRYLRSKKAEGFVSVIAGFSFTGIMLGVATLIIVMSVMNGFREELFSRILGLNGHMNIYGYSGSLRDYNPIAGEIVALENIQSVTPIIESQALITHDGKASGIVVRAMKYTDFIERPLLADSIVQGDLFNFNGGNIAVGRVLARKLGLSVGDEIVMTAPKVKSTPFGSIPRQRSYAVSMIFDVGMHEYNSGFVFMPLPAAQKFFQFPEAVSAIEVFLKDASLLGDTRKKIEDILAGRAGVYDWRDMNRSFYNALQTERNVMFLILTLIILVAAFNIISSMIMLVKDKGHDIAIMRTMGATRLSMMKIFMLTGASIGVIGTFFGAIVGITFALNIDTIKTWIEALSGAELFSDEIYFLSQLPAVIDWNEVMAVIIMAFTLSLLATIYPSWRAARLDPVEALRYE